MGNFKSLKRKIGYYFEYKFMTGHINIGRLTLYGRNAMRWGGHFWTNKYGYICFRLPFLCDGKWWPLYLYFSPDATPQSATFFIGRKHGKDNWAKARIRYSVFGHNFQSHVWNDDYDMENYAILRAINNSVSSTKWNYARYAREHGYDQERD